MGLGNKPAACRRLVIDEADPGRGDPVGVEQDEVGGEPRRHESTVGEPEQPGLVAGEHGHRPLEGEHPALAHPVLERPHGITTVRIGQHVGAGIGGADHGRRVSDQPGHLVVVAVAHDHGDLGLEVVGEGEIEQEVDRVGAPLRTEGVEILPLDPRLAGVAHPHMVPSPVEHGIRWHGRPLPAQQGPRLWIGGQGAHTVSPGAADGLEE